MKRLYVLYDDRCGLCESIAKRLRVYPTYVDVLFLGSQSQKAAELFPDIISSVPQSDVVAIADTGEVYRGDAAWLMTLWAMREYRAWSLTLARDPYRALVKRAVRTIGMHRISLSRFLQLAPTHEQSAVSQPLNSGDACKSNACLEAWKDLEADRAGG